MKALFLGVAAVWIGSLCALTVGALLIRRRHVRAARAAKQPAAAHRSRAGQRTPRPAKHLAPDPGLLVPWSAVRGSKQRFGVLESTLRASTEDGAPAAAPPRSAA